MRPRALLAALPLLLAACAAEEPGDPPAGTPSPSETPLAEATWSPPGTCPGWAAEDRPEGSNCLGILPETCGADRAVGYVGQALTPRIEAVLAGLASDRLRVIGPDMAYTDDLVEGRLNVFTDGDGLIERVDCF